MNVDLPTAADMRARLESAHLRVQDAQIRDLTARITQAVNEGRASIQVTGLVTSVKILLQQRGYEVKHIKGDVRDAGDAGGYYMVTW